MLKNAQYPCWGFSNTALFVGLGMQDPATATVFPEFNKVVYAMLGDHCYFSGTERELCTSTITAAESIIEAIAKQEGVDPLLVHWFDLQTYEGYGDPFDLDT